MSFPIAIVKNILIKYLKKGEDIYGVYDIF